MNPVDKHNAKFKKEWDIPENGVRLENGIGNRLSKNGNSNVLNYLNYIDIYIKTICCLLKSYRYTNPALQPSIDLICNTPYDLMEIGNDRRSRIFEGINKPKDIYHVNVPRQNGTYLSDFDSGRLDKGFRARYRRILLKLRESNGKLRDWFKVKRLLNHELAHTMCNHLMYYNERNHRDDFKMCESLLKHVSEHIENLIFNQYGIWPPA